MFFVYVRCGFGVCVYSFCFCAFDFWDFVESLKAIRTNPQAE